METHRRLLDSQRLRGRSLPIFEVGWVAQDRHSPSPQVDANLIGAAGQGSCSEQGCPIPAAPQHAELRQRAASRHIDLARTGLASVPGDRISTPETVLGWQANAARKIGFTNRAGLELSPQVGRDLCRPGKQDQAGRVGVQAMNDSKILRRIDAAEQGGQRVSIESTARMDRQRRRLVDDDQSIVFPENLNGRIDSGFYHIGKQVLKLLSAAHDPAHRHRFAAAQDVSLFKPALPLSGIDVRVHATDARQQRLAIKSSRYVDGTDVVVGHASRQRRDRLTQPGVSGSEHRFDHQWEC